jgi:hypothetical protein
VFGGKELRPFWGECGRKIICFLFLNIAAGRRWLTPVILATQEAEIRKITIRSQPGQIVLEILSGKPPHRSRAGGVAQGEDPEVQATVPQKINYFFIFPLSWGQMPEYELFLCAI